jgi:DNA-binding NarL/FixJ family response regulator
MSARLVLTRPLAAADLATLADELVRLILGGSAAVFLVTAADTGRATQPRPGPAGSAMLTTRETEVLRGAAAGLRTAELATSLCISTKTAERHLTTIYGKLAVRNRAEAVATALRHGLV